MLCCVLWHLCKDIRFGSISYYIDTLVNISYNKKITVQGRNATKWKTILDLNSNLNHLNSWYGFDNSGFPMCHMTDSSWEKWILSHFFEENPKIENPYNCETLVYILSGPKIVMTTEY